MKILLLNNWGGRLPVILRKFYKLTDQTWRYTEVVDFIEKHAVPIANANDNTAIIKYTDGKNDTYLFKPDNITCTIKDVDTTRPWTILTYDGAEYIQYLDYKEVNRDIGFCTLPQN